MDDQSLELAKAISEGASEGSVRAALEPFVAPVAETGQAITDLVRFQRWKLQFWIATRARKFLEERGIEPSAVSLKVLVPLLDAASLEDEDDEDMKTRWAALLANAAAGAAGAPVSPAYPKILAELEPVEARILDELTRLSSPDTLDVWGLRLKLGLDASQEEVRVAFLAHVGNLDRLGLLQIRWPNSEIRDIVQFLQRERYPDPFQGRPLTQVMKEPQLPQLDERELVTLTELGRAFVRACTPPPSVNDSD